MRFALVVTTDGRPYIDETLQSLRENLNPWPGYRFIVNDSADRACEQQVGEAYPDFTQVAHVHREGFAATVRDAWTEAVASGADYIFHAEDDFTYNEPVNLYHLATLLDANTHLAQIALKRQPVNDEERATGDFMLTRPPQTWRDTGELVEHDLNFTTNPSLIPASVVAGLLAQPEPLSEPTVTRLLQAAGYNFAYLGHTSDPPRVHHIGEHRTQGWQE